MPFYQPIHQKKISCRMFEAEKKYPASTYPKEKKSVWIKGLKKKKKFVHKQWAKKKFVQAENSPLPHHFSIGPSLSKIKYPIRTVDCSLRRSQPRSIPGKSKGLRQWRPHTTTAMAVWKSCLKVNSIFWFPYLDCFVKCYRNSKF